MEIVPGLHCLPGVAQGVNAYIWHPRPRERADGEPILFDCGYPWAVRGLFASLRALECPPEEVRTIAITHDDIDHSGTLAVLQEVSGADVLAHELEIPSLASDHWRAMPVRPTAYSLVLRGVSRGLYATMPKRPVKATRTLRDGDELPGGWVAVFTPGHTPGHLAYFHPGLRVLIAGDAIGSPIQGLIRGTMGPYTMDDDAAREGIRKLAALKPEVICFGHGAELRNAAPALHRLAASI